MIDTMDQTSEEALECPCCRDDARCDTDGTPVAQKEMELYDREDWEGLVALRERLASRHGDDPYCLLRLAEAYDLAGRHEPSLEAAARAHGLEPEHPWYQDAVLRALFALGRSEEDFDWQGEPPPVLRLDEPLMERIERRLETDDVGVDGHPGMVDVGLIFYELQEEGFLAFDPVDLLAAVRADPRFVIEGEPGHPWGSWFITESYRPS